MFKKLKASLGIGSAKVDTILKNPSLYQGEILQGNVHIKGGDVEQVIDAISLKLCTEMKVELENGHSYQTFVLGTIIVNQPFTIHASEEKSLPFEFKLHDETPITQLNTQNNQSKVWLETTLDIDFAIDPSDRDFIEVKSLPAIANVIASIENAGFNLMKADVEKGFLQGGHFASQSGCYQEIEFRNSGFFSSKEIELSFILDGAVIHCLAEIDRSMSTRGDQYTSFSINRNASASDISYQLVSLLGM